MKRILITLLCLCTAPLLSQTPSKPGLSDSPLGKPNPQADQEKKKRDADRQKQSQKISGQLRDKLQAQMKPGLYPEGGVQYTHPGIVVLDEGGSWSGSDNIYNISDHIAVGVEIVVPDEGAFPVRAELIKERVKSILQSAGITPQAELSNNKPPLPFLNIVLIAQPINKGYAVYCAGNLFEQVENKRVQIDNGTFQAMTWDRQHLLVAATEELPFHINQCVDDIAYAFVKLYRYFLDVRPRR
ncbi:MAG: hypothetical protein WC222_05275 [Parachlamydiales bacterium]|jgi:hypothetical protein